MRRKMWIVGATYNHEAVYAVGGNSAKVGKGVVPRLSTYVTHPPNSSNGGARREKNLGFSAGMSEGFEAPLSGKFCRRLSLSA